MCQTQTDDKNNYFVRAKELIQDSKVSKQDKLKICLLFCLRYEGDQICNQLK